jgi:D-alanyl-D-alanine carboxypeptidase/D-alanyl-D-alanine-endopeptidase (penicillin-binding protein 4)
MLPMVFSRFAVFVAALALSAGMPNAAAQSGPSARSDPLPAPVLRALAEAQLSAQALYAVALPLAPGGGRAWGHQAEGAVQPGSTMKLVTSVVALAQLGPNLRGFTELRSAAPLQNGVLQGDLLLRGGADPELGIAQFWLLLQELRQQGVMHITGDLVVDRHHWRPARFDQGLAPFDEAPEFPYNVIPDALQLAGNLLPIAISSDAISSDAQGVRASTVPPLQGLEFTSRMVLNNDACRDWDDGWLTPQVRQDGPRTVLELQGSFPQGCSMRAELQLIDRLELADRLLRTLWQQMGGRWDGRAREATAAHDGRSDTRLLARRQSRPWGEVLRVVNKSSDNALTRMLYLNLGVPAMAAQPAASTAALADQAVRRWFREHQIPEQGLVLDNGSGLSRSERITPLQLARLLQVAYRARYAPDFVMSLPTVGVDGTMRNRIRDSPATGWSRLKTGTLRNVAALAGYVYDPDGQPWAVAMIVNADNAARARPVLDVLVDHMARFGPVSWMHLQPAPPGLQYSGVGPGGDGP